MLENQAAQKPAMSLLLSLRKKASAALKAAKQHPEGDEDLTKVTKALWQFVRPPLYPCIPIQTALDRTGQLHV